ncbi:MAG TPA: F0F1 ATP synthase subunit alpha, partial [Thermoguttaceae bacterium]
QVPAMKKVASGLRLDLASFRELEAFAQLGTELDQATQARLDRGYRMTELLKQGLYHPMHVTDQVLSIYVGTRGHLDKIAISKVHDWEQGFLKFIHEEKQDLWKKITAAGQIDEASMAGVNQAIAEFQKRYAGKKDKATVLA